jgi:recombination protein RecR
MAGEAIQPGRGGEKRNAQTSASAKPARRSSYPAVVDRLMEQLSSLPGVGRRSAERLAFHILKSTNDEALALSKAIADVKQRVRHCDVCWNLTDHVPSMHDKQAHADDGGEDRGEGADAPRCELCRDVQRDRGVVLVVEQPKDLIALEQTGMFKGIYHVLMGRISPLDGIGPEELTVAGLIDRIDRPQANPGGVPVREVILGLNPTVEGDGTALYLMDEISRRPSVRVTRLARGLPTGSQLEFANKAVLADAIAGRQDVR